MTAAQCQTCKFYHDDRPCFWPESQGEGECTHHKVRRGVRKTSSIPAELPRVSVAMKPPEPDGSRLPSQEATPVAKKGSSVKEVMVYLTPEELTWLDTKAFKRLQEQRPRDERTRSAIIREAIDKEMEREKQE